MSYCNLSILYGMGDDKRYTFTCRVLQALGEAEERHLEAMSELQERLQKDKDDSLQILKTSVTAEKQVGFCCISDRVVTF